MCSGAHGPARGALEGSEAAGERRLELRGEEDSQLCDDASCDELVRGHVKCRVPNLDTCQLQKTKTLTVKKG